MTEGSASVHRDEILHFVQDDTVGAHLRVRPKTRQIGICRDNATYSLVCHCEPMQSAWQSFLSDLRKQLGRKERASGGCLFSLVREKTGKEGQPRGPPTKVGPLNNPLYP